MSAQLTAPFTMAPVAGALAILGLYLPWLVSAGAALVVLVFTLVHFQDGKHFVEPPEKQIESSKSDDAVARSPIRDPVLLLCAFVYTVMLSGVSGLQILLPVTLEQSSFGLVDHSSLSRTRQNV